MKYWYLLCFYLMTVACKTQQKLFISKDFVTVNVTGKEIRRFTLNDIMQRSKIVFKNDTLFIEESNNEFLNPILNIRFEMDSMNYFGLTKLDYKPLFGKEIVKFDLFNLALSENDSLRIIDFDFQYSSAHSGSAFYTKEYGFVLFIYCTPNSFEISYPIGMSKRMCLIKDKILSERIVSGKNFRCNPDLISTQIRKIED